MCRQAVAALFLVLCLQVCSSGIVQAGETLSARVRWVADGDTLFLQDGETVRLKGVDAPELGRDGEPDQHHARKSRDGLAGLVEHRVLSLELDGQKRDRYDRLLAWVRLPDGRLLQEVLLERGLVFVYPHPGDSLRHHDALLRTQQRAMDARRGFWGRILDLPVAEKTFTGNKRSMRFHAPGCPNGLRISRGNKVWFGSLEAAFRSGYAPARQCTPWPPGR
ncbi:MAG: thermonuclease family protein [Desulfohalobiaceae bacterium]